MCENKLMALLITVGINYRITANSGLFFPVLGGRCQTEVCKSMCKFGKKKGGKKGK